MEAIKCIMTRRSIRQYTDEPVEGEVVEKLLRAAMAAPSAANCQPWQFVVVRDQAKREAFAGFHPYGKMLASAPIGILVCGDTELELADGYWVQDCSAATENLLLAAHALGLGAVWLGITPREDRTAETRELFGLPENVIPLGMMSIGHPAEEKGSEDRFQPSRVHHDQW
ncbi:MAG TPA: nitroreductase family protein [Armatimonadota bacterium]|nr:nitroreductase family protein [Armatimonadota bacterium]